MFGLGQIDWFVWSPDNSHLLGRQGSRIVERSVTGAGGVRTLTEAPGLRYLDDISPDGKVALYLSTDRLFSVPLDGARGGRPIPVVQTDELIATARFSPDGRWIVYDAATAQGERLGIFVQPFPGPGLRRQITSSGVYPVWRQDGKEIVYWNRKSNQISAISVSGVAGDLRFGSPSPLFAAPPNPGFIRTFNPIAVTRDGSRIIIPQALPQPEDSNVIHIKSGWIETQH